MALREHYDFTSPIDRVPLADALAASVAAVRSIPTVYPGYIALRIKKALLAADPENIIAGVGDITTIGDCRYAIPVTDHNGTIHTVTVEVEDGR